MSELLIPSLGAILKIKEERASLGKSSIDLLIGDPDHGPPKVLTEVLHNAIKSGNHNGYTDQQGDLETRAVICEYLKKEDIFVDPENIFISGGSKPIAYAAIQMLKKPNTKVVMLKPYYPSYINQILSMRISPDIVNSENDMIKKIANDKYVSTAIVVSPNNPDGKTYDNNFLMECVHFCKSNDIQLVIDEAYKDFKYKDPFESLASKIDDFEASNVTVIRTFSKSLAICGWRLGYSISSEKTAKKLKLFQSTANNPPNSLVQAAIKDSLMQIDDSYFEGNRKKYEDRLKTFTDLLNSNGIEADMPDGGFYIFLDLSGYIGSDKKYKDSKEFSVELARQTGVLTWPGVDYGNDCAIRISLASVKKEDLTKAPKDIAGFLEKIKK